MPTPVKMPKLDRLSTEGTIVEWLKHDGDRVEKGEVICIVESVKTTFEIESPESGILFQEERTGPTVSIGQIIATVLQPGEDRSTVKSPARVTHEPVERLDSTSDAKSIRAAPSVRRLAKERGIELSRIKGSGPEGRILLEDITSYAERTKPQGAIQGVQVLDEIPLIGWRKTLAERMSLSNQENAQVTTIAEVDVTELVALKNRLSSRSGGTSITYTAFSVRAVAQALKSFPIMNSTLSEDTIIVYKNCNVAVAIAREKLGLIAPVIHDADKKSLSDIAVAIRELREKASRNALSPEDLAGGTFTLTNPGTLGVIMDTPMINYPQVAILGVGAIVKRPVVRDDQIVIRSIMMLSLSYDHRIIDGAPAIRFLQEVRRLLERPNELQN